MKPAEHDALRARLASLASEEAKLRRTLDEVRSSILNSSTPEGSGAESGVDSGVVRAQVVETESELRVLLDSLSQHLRTIEEALDSESGNAGTT